MYPARPIWTPEQDIDVLNGWMLFLGGLGASRGTWEVLYGDVKRRKKNIYPIPGHQQHLLNSNSVPFFAAAFGSAFSKKTGSGAGFRKIFVSKQWETMRLSISEQSGPAFPERILIYRTVFK